MPFNMTNPSEKPVTIMYGGDKHTLEPGETRLETDAGVAQMFGKHFGAVVQIKALDAAAMREIKDLPRRLAKELKECQGKLKALADERDALKAENDEANRLLKLAEEQLKDRKK